MSDLSPTASTARRIRLGMALLGLLAGLVPAHATYPGENGAIVYSFGSPRTIGRVIPGNNAIATLSQGFGPRVSPNGRKIAFLNGSSVWDSDVHVMDMDGTNIVRLTSGARARAVTWSPDGSQLAYVAPASANNARYSLWTMRSDGTAKNEQQQLWAGMRVSAPGLEWSPKGDTFAYTGADNGVWLQPLGSTIGSLLKNANASPSWTPDGQTVLYAGIYGVGQIDADGTDDRALPFSGSIGRIAMSPDGKQIAGTFDSGSASVLKAVSLADGQINNIWPVLTADTDWARMPKNCHATTVQGGGGVLAGDVDFYADHCVIAVSPNAINPSGILAMALMLGQDGRVYARTLKAMPGGTSAWDPVKLLPGVGRDPEGIKALKLSVAATRDGTFHAVIINAADQLLYHALRNGSGVWSGFNRMVGDAGAPGFRARDVAIAAAGTNATPGDLQVVASNLVTGGLYHSLREPTGRWFPFAKVPGAEGKVGQALAIAATGDRHANVLAITTAADGSQARLQQVLRDPNGNWGAWVDVPLPVGVNLSASSDVAMARTDENNSAANVMVMDTAGRAWFQVRNNPNLTSSWQGQEPTELITTGARSVSLSSGGGATQILVTRAYPQQP